jgi:hypothetical protein
MPHRSIGEAHIAASAVIAAASCPAGKAMKQELEGAA